MTRYKISSRSVEQTDLTLRIPYGILSGYFEPGPQSGPVMVYKKTNVISPNGLFARRELLSTANCTV